MGFFKKQRKKRVCVIGLDGVPRILLLDLAQRGVMPSAARLIESGHLHPMKASLPEISSVSWTNFMTGSNPGQHGIFGFTDFKKSSYDLRFPNFLDLKTETFWDRLGKEGKKCIIINQPSTYPARRINGVLISGFVAIELAKAVFPFSLKDRLVSLGYQIDIDTLRCRENHGLLWKDLEKTLLGRKKALHLLWEEDWDYLELVITGTDRLNHFVWDAYQNQSHPYHKNFLAYYNQIDEFIEEMVNSFEKINGSLEGLYLLSDHGFTGIEHEFYLNAWLEKEGFLRFNSASPSSLNEISPETQAFALDPSRIYLNLQGRFPQGAIGESNKNSLKEELRKKLEKLEYQGKKVVRTVFDANKIYSGPQVSSGPDLVVLSEPGFDLKGSLRKKEAFGRTNLVGMHTWDDAFFWSLKREKDDLSIEELASIILENF